MTKERLFLIYIVILGCTFIVSSISKMLPIVVFEFQLVRDGITSWTLAPYFARALVFAELLIGLHLLLYRQARIAYLTAAILVLSFFTVYLAFVLVNSGNQENCGCFGQLLPMSTTAALIKNIVLLIPGIYFLYPALFAKLNINRMQAVSTIIILFVMVILFPVRPINQPVVQTPAPVISVADSAIALPVKNNAKQIIARDTTAVSLFNRLRQGQSGFAQFNSFSQGKINLDQGIQLLALFSLDCEHCLAIATKIGSLQKTKQLPVLNALLFGDTEQIKSFQSQSNVQFNYLLLPPETFFPLLKKSPPRLLLIAKGNILYDAEGDAINLDSLKQKLHLLK